MAISEHIRRITAEFEQLGFTIVNKRNAPLASGTWIENAGGSERAVRTFLWLAFKPASQIVSIRIGWRSDSAYEFCVDTMKESWGDGYRWFRDAKVLDVPCLQTFNLAQYMKWRFIGIRIDEFFDAEVSRLKDVISSNGCIVNSSEELFDRYAREDVLASWFSGNAALRLGEIAGLSVLLKKDKEEVMQVANKYLKSIQQDMYSLGTAEQWVKALVNRLT
ncbi:hypothetical protein [Herbaspirillum sp. alder98]|uniref:hypothetical protein n=1 Tax=Herbaspirillum sp. alder98 TaxID=2913096 RepID=UPI001CD884FB|nr:hypothetical protein [Herbaspirillum sp. alder98]MCA1323611.1 hypothetical protein [Herbaspirillum sp. alder98]